MARIIAFAGASRVGKTTLMNAVAEKIRKHGAGDLVQVYSSEVGAWYAELGVDASANTDFDTRLRLQEAIADRYIAKVHSFEPSKAGVPSSDQLLFMDRSWADLCAYTLADVPRDITPEQDETVQRIISKLTALAPYQACCFVRPGIPLAPPQQGKANASHSFQQHIDLLISGQLISYTVLMHALQIDSGADAIAPILVMHPEDRELEVRVAAVLNWLAHAFNDE